MQTIYGFETGNGFSVAWFVRVIETLKTRFTAQKRSACRLGLGSGDRTTAAIAKVATNMAAIIVIGFLLMPTGRQSRFQPFVRHPIRRPAFKTNCAAPPNLSNTIFR